MSPTHRRLGIRKFRRWLVSSLGTRNELRTQTKLLIATLLFALSLATKSLHAADLASVMYTTDQPFNGLTEGYDSRAVSIQRGEGLLGPYGIDPSNTATLEPGAGLFNIPERSLLRLRKRLLQSAACSKRDQLAFAGVDLSDCRIACELASWNRIGIARRVIASPRAHIELHPSR